jgi:hypothetical protein
MEGSQEKEWLTALYNMMVRLARSSFASLTFQTYQIRAWPGQVIVPYDHSFVGNDG